MILRTIGVCLISLISLTAIAATPAIHSDSEEHAWYSQQWNLKGGNCCGLGDAFILEEDEWKDNGDDTYQVKIDGEWYTVDAKRRRDLSPDPLDNNPLRGTPSPSKKAVVWYDLKGENGKPRIWCFSPWENLY